MATVWTPRRAARGARAGFRAHVEASAPDELARAGRGARTTAAADSPCCVWKQTPRAAIAGVLPELLGERLPGLAVVDL